MKNYIVITFSFFGILLTLNACSDNSTGGDSSNEPTLEKVANILNVQQGAGLVYRKALEETGDTLASLDTMGKWIGNNEAVEEAYYHDLESIRIHYNNGLKSSIHIVPTDEEGVHLTRGGGTTTGIKNIISGTEKNKIQEIRNKKVLVLIPFTAQFEYFSSEIAELRQSFGSDFQVDVITDNDVRLDDINKMSDYGFIILDTHGKKHGFYIGRLEREFVEQDPWLVDDWTPENTQRDLLEPYRIPIEKIENGEIEITQNIEREDRTDFVDDKIVRYQVDVFTISIIVTENYIRNSNIDLTDAIVFGNHCYSGHEADGRNKNNMSEAWRSKGAAAYFGYAFDNGISTPVANKFALAMEKALIKRLVGDTDTTGVAHLKDDGTRYFWDSRKHTFRDGRAVTRSVNTPDVEEKKPVVPFYFNQYFDMDYSYDTCSTLIDSRDGEEYELACIGDQTWMAENLNYSKDGEGVCYDNSSANCDKYGRLYSGQELSGGQISTETTVVQGLCPEDWHVPSETEYEELIEFSGGWEESVDKLRSVSGWPEPHSDEFGFNLKPGGYLLKNPDETNFYGMGSQAPLLTSSLSTHGDAVAGEDYRLVLPRAIGNAYTEWKYSCRCVKDQDQ